MSTPIVVTVVLLIVIGMTIFFYLRRSIDDKQNIPGVRVDTVSAKKIYQDRGYAPAFQGKIQKFVDDKRVIDNQITKISDQSKRLRIVEVELKNKLIKQKTEAELKRSLDSQFRLDNELSIEEVSQLDNSERDRKLQIDETAKVLEQITSTVKIIDSKLIEVKLAKNKEYEDKVKDLG
jgi:Rps23 Pro-64 3,4-dihydroxylase Tpa1-like proline 4-hydroxylase